MDRATAKRELLEREPRLVDITRGALAKATAPVPADDPELALFAKDVRALLGFEQLPDPVTAWTVRAANGDLLVRRTLAVGKLELRCWEGELVLFRRPLRPLKKILADVLSVPLGDAIELERIDDDTELLEAQLVGRFERVVAFREGRSILLALAPRIVGGAVFETAHELASDHLIEQTRRRHRPPGPFATPSPLFMPAGGRYPKKLPPRKKRVKR